MSDPVASVAADSCACPCCFVCQVPAENVLGGVNQGVKVLMSGLDYERLVLAAGPVGIMQSCLDVAVPYSTQRKQFGTPIGQFQVTAELICFSSYCAVAAMLTGSIAFPVSRYIATLCRT